jgi:hypothetical protein
MSQQPPVVDCPDCAGLTFALVACQCTRGGDRMLIDGDTFRAGAAYRDCRLCQGVGTVARPCSTCQQRGRRRAHLVLTVANLDTGAVASASIVPGSVPPDSGPDGHPQLDLTSVVRDLAATVGAASVTEVGRPGQVFDELTVYLPHQWRPDLPAEDRHALEAAALARRSYDPWLVYLGRTKPPVAPDPAEQLARLCTLASQLCLDLVLEVRHHQRRDPTWLVRYDVPGARVPTDQLGRFDTLTAALTTITIPDALYDLHERGRTAPAHHVILNRPPPPPSPTDLDLDQLERRIVADCVDCHTGTPTAGAQAIWRDNRWWHTSLRTAGSTETETGQIRRREQVVLCRGWEPPEPSWLGPPIPSVACPDCQPDNRLQTCYCTLGGRPVDPHCADCHGVGRHPRQSRCHTCLGSHRIHLGAAITLTDLFHEVTHLNWLTDPDQPPHTPLVATQPGGKPVVQLPDYYRLAHWANIIGVRPEHLTELDGGDSISQDIRDGIVTLPHPEADPLTAHLNRITAGLPGARLLINTAAPDAPALTDLIRLAHGLHLAVAITIENHRLYDDDPLRIHGERWQVDLVPPDQAPDPTPGHASPEFVRGGRALFRVPRNCPGRDRPHRPAPADSQPTDPGPGAGRRPSIADPATRPPPRRPTRHRAPHPNRLQ